MTNLDKIAAHVEFLETNQYELAWDARNCEFTTSPRLSLEMKDLGHDEYAVVPITRASQGSSPKVS